MPGVSCSLMAPSCPPPTQYLEVHAAKYENEVLRFQSRKNYWVSDCNTAVERTPQNPKVVGSTHP